MGRLLCYMAVSLLLATTLGCLDDPARSNPFDARSDAFVAVGAVTGRVLDGAAQPLPRAAVLLERIGPGAATDAGLALRMQTDDSGRFRFEEVPAGAYRFTATREAAGVSHRDTVEVEAGRVLDLQPVRLNAPPVFTEVAYVGVHLRQWALEPGDVYQLEVEASVTDPEVPEGGVEEVWLEVPGEEWAVVLPLLRPGRYGTTLEAAQLPDEALHALVGVEAWLRARDREGAVGAAGPLVLERVVEQVPMPTAPADYVQVATARPTFRWEAFSRPFPFTFTVRVDRVQDDLVLPVWERRGVGASTTSLQVSDALAPGTYVWTVAAVDAFGNRGRSAQAGFRVVEE